MSEFIFEKQPQEELTFGVDFSGAREIQNGETISLVDIIITNKNTPVSDIFVSKSIIGNIVRVRVRGGENNKNYKITILITTNLHHIRETDIMMYVRET